MRSPIRASWHVGRVASRRRETASAVRLELDVPTWPGNPAGSHLDVRLTAPDGYQATRSYSVASSGETTRVILAIDELPSGEVSPYLVHQLAEGDELEVHGPLGRYFVWIPTEFDRSPVQLIAGGSGVVPLFAMAVAREHETVDAEFRLLYSVRTPEDVFFAEELSALSKTTVDVVHTRTSPPGSPRAPGRLTPESVADLVFPATATPRIFLCGPTPFVETIAGWLLQLGHDPTRIRTERFGGSG
ncbi:FAD-binding oxidoreductase [Mycobacteroides abscessus]|uniref:FAD-binding oxidoreductase n=1 Tax=Mycobacteroides abscessus TaxID=36809 RepID=UPI00092C3585|nr:FAD-binding oxidoreductase [Mycobacteroides abscessus]SHW90362.1 benzoate 1,2-dioxygenase electron transfer component [Mycobacteroides abscessus subsp. abscessus]SII11876.1 benzoate 1,2-dioxygenase electron transfer component [Mycobacteroides abscessus subsp. abscessus]